MKRTMNRLMGALGTLLVALGISVLVYVGVTYANAKQPTAAKAPSWSLSQHAAGHRLQSRLVGHQTVSVPRAMTRVTANVNAQATRMVIPAIGVDSPVVQTQPVQGVWQVADWSVGHLSTTPGPGVDGNGAYAAHDDIKGEIFKRLGELKPGDPILLYGAHNVYHYSVVNQLLVDPSNTKVLDPTPNPTITLITCSPYWVDGQRIIVQAALKTTTAR